MAIILIWHDFPIICHHLLVSIEILNMSVYHCDLINSTLYLCPSYSILFDVTIHFFYLFVASYTSILMIAIE